MYLLKVSILVDLILTVFVHGKDSFSIVDTSEFERRFPKIRYHLYNPQLFYMYTECLPLLRRPCYFNRMYNVFSHGLDINFVEAIIALNQSVPPSEADLFIIPVFYNQATVWDMPCHTNDIKGTSRLINQMMQVLHSQGYYKPNVRNHFLMADHYASGLTLSWDAFIYPPEFIVGRFEIPIVRFHKTVVNDMSQFISVGYATKNGVYANCPFYNSTRLINASSSSSSSSSSSKSIHNRKYLMSFTGGFKTNEKEFFYRSLLYEYVNTHNNSTLSGIYVSFYRKGLPFSDTNPRIKASHIVQDSLISLSIRGDTPTTDRIWIAFEFLTLIGVLSVEKEALLPLLPFPKRVPWEKIIVWIDTDAFVANPVEAMRSTAMGLDKNERERRYNLMVKHRRDVLWAYQESVAVMNVLEEAVSLVKVLV